MLGIRRIFLFGFAFLLLSGSRTCGQNPQAQFPAQFGRWTAAGAPRKFTPNFGSDERKRAVFAESAVSQAATGSYTFDGKGTTATVYAFQDSSGAYEAFTYLWSPGLATFDSSLSHAGVFTKDRAVLAAGNFVVELAPASDVSMGDLRDLLRRIAAAADKTPFPPIQTFLPKQGQLPDTQRYALGPAAFRAAAESVGLGDFAAISDQAGFNSGAEATFMRYKTGRTGGQEAVLLLIEYPTPQLAELHLRHLEGALSAAKQSGSSIERKGSLLSIVLAPTSAAYAESLRAGVNYETQVTWNEPSATATDPPWSSVLAKIFIGTGVFMVVAVVLGVAFGGVRVVTKIFFPGKVFDRPEQMEILQLGLSGSKRIDPRDFY